MASLDDEKLIHLFTTPILKYIWPDSEQLNRRLRRAILKEESVSAGTTYSSVGGWQSNEDFQSWAGEAGRTIVQQVAEMVQHATHEIHSTYRGQVERNTWSISVWANVNRKGDYHRNHLHPGSTWSGVYIVDSGNVKTSPPQSGMLALMNANLASPMRFYRDAIPLRYGIHPEPGLMVIWPSYLVHMVHPHQGRRTLVSISFNIKKEPYP